MTISLRTRLLSGVVIGMAVLLIIFCIVIYSISSHVLFRQFDNSLSATANMLSAVIEAEGLETKDGEGHQDENKNNLSGLELDFEFDVRMTPEFNNLSGGGYYQFWNNNGKILKRSPSLGQKNLPKFGDGSLTPEFQDNTLPDGKPGRAISLYFIPRSEKDDHRSNLSVNTALTLVVARDVSELYDYLHFLKWLLFGASLGILLLSTCVGFVVTQLGLRPISILAGDIATIREDNLSKVFLTGGYPEELLPICECLNVVMERLEASFERERQFSADVAHELRTPLAGIRSILEVALTRTREIEEYKTSASECLEISNRMQAIVNDLLILTRLENKQVALRCESIHIKKFIDSIWQSFASNAFNKNITFENNLPDELTINSDPDQLQIVISNIIDNSIEYTNNSGLIQIKAQQSEDSTKIVFANTGCKLTEKQLTRVFDRFWRGDSSRTDTGIHCGLGLALVQRIAKVLGGSCGVRTDEDKLFILELSFESPRLQSSSGA